MTRLENRRYDARHLLADEQDFVGEFIPLSPKAREEERLADDERWTFLPDVTDFGSEGLCLTLSCEVAMSYR